MLYNDPQVNAMVLRLRKKSMKFFKNQAAEFLGVTDYILERLIKEGKIFICNQDQVAQARSAGHKKIYEKFTLDELKRAKKALAEESRLKAEEERRKKLEEEQEKLRKKEEKAAETALAEIRHPEHIHNNVLLVAKKQNELEQKLNQVLQFMEEFKPLLERLDKAML